MVFTRLAFEVFLSWEEKSEDSDVLFDVVVLPLSGGAFGSAM